MDALTVILQSKTITVYCQASSLWGGRWLSHNVPTPVIRGAEAYLFPDFVKSKHGSVDMQCELELDVVRS